MRGDEPMDRLVDWMIAEGLPRTRPLFEAAVSRGIRAVPNAPPPLHDFFTVAEARPAWVEERLLRAGVQASGRAGLTGMMVLRDLGLLAGYRFAAINKTLVLTGALEGGAQRRLAETTRWWLAVTRPGGMDPCAPGYRETLHVRLVHALVRRRVSSMPEWNPAHDGVPINQCDMQATYFGFSIVYLIGSRAMGVKLSPRDGAAIMHLWRYVAWLMGVEERWLCAFENEGRIALYQNLLSQMGPDESSRRLGRALENEPLQRHYPNLGWLRGRWNRAKHLSVARAFVGADGMEALGLPRNVLPWYPILTVPLRFLFHRAASVIPFGRAWVSRSGLRAQQQYLATLTGPRRSQDGRHGPRVA
jgi:hypothetical protein